MKLKPGQWFMWSIDDPMPERLTVCEGPVETPVRVTTISRFQAMALSRWHGQDGVFFGHKDGNGRWVDVYVVGDIDAWLGPETY